MKIKEAIILRFQELCQEKNLAYNELATLSGVTPSTVYSMMDSKRKDLSVLTVKKLCDGLEINMETFFSAEYFNNLEQEIQ